MSIYCDTSVGHISANVEQHRYVVIFVSIKCMYRAVSICCQASCFLTAIRLYFEEGVDMLFTRVVLVLCNSMSRANNRRIDISTIDVSTMELKLFLGLQAS